MLKFIKKFYKLIKNYKKVKKIEKNRKKRAFLTPQKRPKKGQKMPKNGQKWPFLALFGGVKKGPFLGGQKCPFSMIVAQKTPKKPKKSIF